MMKYRKVTVEEETLDTLKDQPCFAKDCKLPVIGGRTTDDGMKVNFCEFHFAENFISMVDEETKEEALFELAKILALVQNESKHQPRLLN